MENLLRRKAYERMNAFQALSHPWITGVPQKVALKTGLTIKLSFKANQAMERLFTLMAVGIGLEAQGVLKPTPLPKQILPENKAQIPSILSLDNIETRDTPEDRNSISGKENTARNTAQGRGARRALEVLDGPYCNTKGSVSKHLRDVLDTIMRREKIGVRKPSSTHNLRAPKPHNFRISGLRGKSPIN